MLKLKALRKAPLTAKFGLAVVVLYVVLSLFAPVIAPYSETQIVGPPYAPWSSKFLVGTDNLGRDMLSRLLFGGRNTIGLALLITCIAMLIGGTLGLFAAVVGGFIDEVLSRSIDTVMAIPQIILALLFLTILSNSVPVLIVVISLIEATRVFRIARAMSQGTVVMDYVDAARARGEKTWWIARREVLPNALPPLIAEFGARFVFTFLFISSLSFLGLGIQPPTAVWGSMVRDNALLITFGDLTPLLPAVAIGLLAVCVNLVVDWVLDLTSGLKG